VVNSDPLGAGWIYKIKLSNPAELNTLMEEEDYDARMMAG
jgi:glycine cleavage system H protein